MENATTNPAAPDQVVQDSAAKAVPATPPAEKTTKSIVPARYAGRYKAGGNDALAEFIKKQCSGKEGFEFPAFFALSRKNLGGSLTEEKIAHYEKQVADKRHGAEGRARMTIRNMLATTARKNGKLIALDGSEVTIELAKPAVSGAAATAQANTAKPDEPAKEAAPSQF
jgi:hypothetical protein